jgi:outer membrane protein OmpA-like peptidoglycan-associated protein
MAVGCVSVATAHNKANSVGQRQPQYDTVVLATYQEDDYLVKRYMVNVPDDRVSDYSVRYSINVAHLQPNLDDNSEALRALSNFIEQTMADTVARISSVTITGYASPDGPYALNERLAKQRAQDFKSYVDSKYNFSTRYAVTASGVAEDWENCRAMIESSLSIPHKDSVLRIINSAASNDTKEMQLKKMTDTWNFMRTDILPRLRRVDIVINYARGTIVEERTLIEPVLEETVVEEVVVPHDSRCAECGVAGCKCGNDCTCNGNGMIIEVDDQLLQMVEGVVTEQIDTELIEVGIPANRAQNR